MPASWRLSHTLLDTYQTINERYYAHKKARARGAAAGENLAPSARQWDDSNGDYIIREGDILNGRYKIAKMQNHTSPLIGKGSFGQVLKP